MSVKNVLIVGAGVVGHATGTGFERKGHHVTYVDIAPAVINKLRGDGHRAMLVAEVNWKEVDIIMLTVSTPTRNDKIVLSHVMSAMRDIAAGLQNVNHFVTVVVRSTVPPTTTEQILLPLLEEGSGKKVGAGFGVAVNPEFLRQTHAIQDFDRPWITVLGCADSHTTAVLKDLYTPFGAMIVYCSPTEAEMIKYVNNIYNAVKISYFNEVHAICQHLGINGDTVASVVSRSAEAMWNPLYGTRGGVPYGGACLPKDGGIP
jgi:UDPglucose 6-dehydrogenase